MNKGFLQHVKRRKKWKKQLMGEDGKEVTGHKEKAELFDYSFFASVFT